MTTNRLGRTGMMYTIYLAVLFSLLWLGFDNGVVGDVLAADPSLFSEGIIILWVAGMALASFRVYQAAVLLDYERENGDYMDCDFELWAGIGVAPIDLIARILFRLGLMGTVYGFFVALSGLNFDNLTDASTLGAEIGQLMDGTRIALVTTLVGVLTNVVLTVAIKFLEITYARIELEREGE